MAFVLLAAIFFVNGIGFVQNETSAVHNENANNTSTVTRDSQTILLEGESLPGNSFLHLYDSTPYQIIMAMLLQRFHA